jgi:glutamine amidotransferase
VSGGGPRVALVDHGAGNLLSIGHALASLGADVTTVNGPAGVRGARLVVMPGVGAPGPAMRRMRAAGLDEALARALAEGAWCLGICLGMQLMFTRSTEDATRCLGWLDGAVEPIPDAPLLPHIGWNELETVSPHPMFDGVSDRAAVYFVHSYAPVPADPGIVVARTVHGGRFASAVATERLIGLQFHPEKSGRDGLRILANVLRLVAADDATADRGPGPASNPASGPMAAGPARAAGLVRVAGSPREAA